VIWTKRNSLKEPKVKASSVFADLDAMIVEPVSIKVLGVEHTLSPLSLEQFFKITSSWSELEALKQEKTTDALMLLDKYHEIISAALPTIERKDLDSMSIQQIGALMQIVFETVTGKTFGTEEKKTLMPARALHN
jgi:hypothetical protein